MARLVFSNPYRWLAASMLLVSLLVSHQAVSGADDDAAAIQQAKGLSRAFRAAAKAVLPTVVEIRSTVKPRPVEGRLRQRNPLNGTPFEDFFDDDAPGFRWHTIPDMPNLPSTGLGAGVIIDASGIILTNNHVVEGADEVTVVMPDGRQFKATDVRRDTKSDLAVLRIQAESPLPFARLGDSEKLEIGDWVLAIGSPFKLESTVSAGIISAKARSLAEVGRASFLQTDAAINPGNSGGPLVNLDGEVVGINTAIASRSGGYQGIGFAIPANLVRWVTQQLIQRGAVQRAYLGVAIDRIDAERAKALGVRPHEGVVVGKVYPKSPAEEAGLRENDVILSIDGQPINSAAGLQETVERLPPDSKHEMRVLRDNKPRVVNVVVRAMPESFGIAGAPGEEDPQAVYQNAELGFAAVDLTQGLAEHLGYRTASGALVLQVERQGIAYRAGLRDGMLIVRAGNRAIKNLGDLQQVLRAESSVKELSLQVQTRSGSQTIVLKRR